MKTYTLILLLSLYLVPVYSQNRAKKVKREVMSEDILRNWKPGKTKTFFGQKITKLSKDDGGITRTNIVFWPVMGKGEMVRFVSQTNKPEATFENTSGKIALFIDRQSEAEANTELYTITLENEKGEEFHAVQMPAKQPTYYMYGIWYNYVEVEVPLEMPVFNVVVKDALGGKVYKYRVSASLEGIPQDQQQLQVLSQR
jgi:hypothetical protein